MSDLTMVLHSPDDILPVSGSGNDHDANEPMNPDLPSPSSSYVTTPSTSTTSSPPTDNDGDKDMERIPFIDPEDVIGRRVMFDLPPLPIESEWGLPPEPKPNKSNRLLIRQLSSPEDDVQSRITTFTNLSESESQKDKFANENALDDSLSLSAASVGQGAEFMNPLWESNCKMVNSATKLKVLTPQSSEEDCIHPPFRNGIPNVLEEELVYEDYFFIHWNWPMIRCACKVSLITIMIGLLCIAIGLILTAPRSCEPPREWWQGGVVYEIFPAAFQDSDNDGFGDLAGLSSRLDYIEDLGISAVRLNSIYESDDYPLKYWSILNLTAISPVLGTLQDFENLVDQIHAKNIRIVLDFNPVYLSKNNQLISAYQQSMILKMGNTTSEFPSSEMTNETYVSNLNHGYVQQEIQRAMAFWLSKGIDGFYMKYLEVLDITPQLLFNLLEWRSLMDRYESQFGRKILVCSGSFLDRLEMEIKNGRKEAFLGLFDLVEYQIQFEPEVVDFMPQEIDRYTIRQFGNGVPSPTILWSTGTSETSRLATRLGIEQAFAAILVQLMLPGTINLFYGDEIHLEDYSDSKQAAEFANQLVPMRWTLQEGFTNSSSRSWLLHFSQEFSHDGNGSSASLDILRTVIRLRNASTPLFVSSMLHRGEHGSTRKANYKVRFCNEGMVALERFYPRWNSFVVLANLGVKARQVDLSSTFYQGKIIVSTDEKAGDIVFRNVQLKSGEALIARL